MHWTPRTTDPEGHVLGTGSLLEVRNLTVSYPMNGTRLPVVRDISFDLNSGQIQGMVGESGSGKTQTMLALLGLLAPGGVANGRVRLQGQELLGLPSRTLNQIRGKRIALIPQDALSALNPHLKIATQMVAVLKAHQNLHKKAALHCAIEMLERVHIPDAARRIHRYPHEFSGGMRQRVLIALSLLCRPWLLIADEPTTALDVTIQAGILRLFQEIRAELGTAILLITHNLGVVAQICESIHVMYAGRIVESGSTAIILQTPRHPYTQALLANLPRLDEDDYPLAAIPGHPPSPEHQSSGCCFHPRCRQAFALCRTEDPPLRPIGEGQVAACHRLNGHPALP